MQGVIVSGASNTTQITTIQTVYNTTTNNYVSYQLHWWVAAT